MRVSTALLPPPLATATSLSTIARSRASGVAGAACVLLQHDVQSVASAFLSAVVDRLVRVVAELRAVLDVEGDDDGAARLPFLFRIFAASMMRLQHVGARARAREDPLPTARSSGAALELAGTAIVGRSPNVISVISFCGLRAEDLLDERRDALANLVDRAARRSRCRRRAARPTSDRRAGATRSTSRASAVLAHFELGRREVLDRGVVSCSTTLTKMCFSRASRCAASAAAAPSDSATTATTSECLREVMLAPLSAVYRVQVRRRGADSIGGGVR